ncbi:methyl-accepting chemotaxis protein [Aneurinibacillus tyrosinisolvens]|uniref:methyl-accepting chemotaxis protein n=1 Tax=Aneurinibacillus tyrosinisolvens TaxID=1443435 RepID=UPI00063F38DE|nr:methyl-accepting chemotaxis protein [Aneurinibacillus tyrosinisolvens]
MGFLKAGHSISRKISLGFIIPFTAFSLFFSFMLYATSTYIINKQVAPGFENILKVRMEGLQTIAGPVMVNGAIQNPRQYEQLVTVLNNYQKRAGVENVYVLAKENGKGYLIALSNSKEHKTAYPFTRQMDAALQGSTEISQIYEDKRGVHKTIFAPVLGTSAILAIDMDAEFIKKLEQFIFGGSVFLIFLNMAIGWLISSFIAKKITKPIVSLAEHARQLTSGDLTNEITNPGTDEIGMLAGGFEQLRQKLINVIQQMNQSSHLVGNAGKELLLASQQVADESKHISLAASEVAAGQENRTGYIKEVSDLFTKTAEAVAKVDGKIKEIALSSGHSRELSQRGNEQVKEISTQMDRILSRGAEASEQLKQLGVRSQEIAEVIHIIKQIASQINLLSLNASIEAARAGDAGRGFAVVAQEIQRLAGQTNHSVGNIIESVQAIQQASNNAIQSNEVSFQEVVRGSELVEINGQIFEEIYQAVSDVASGTTSIEKEAEGMTDRTNQVLGSIQQITAISVQEVASVQEVSVSVAQQSHSIEQLKTLSENLNRLYENLESSILVFTLPQAEKMDSTNENTV